MENRDIVKTSILKKLPIFSGLTEDNLRIIAPIMQPVSFKAGEDVIHEGERGHSLYIIHRGSVEVFQSGGGEEVSLGILSEGNFFGELSLFDDHPRSATVRAVQDTDFFNLTRRDLIHCLENHIELANILLRNTIMEIFSRFRTVTCNFTFSQHHINDKNTILKEMDRDMRAASEVQNFFIRAEDDESINLKHGIVRHYTYLPSKAIGGDFMSIINDPAGNICAIIADVEGHGISASLATGVLKSAFSFLAPDYGRVPVDFMSRLNNHLFHVLNRLYATCYYAYIDVVNMKISFSKAGHYHPFFWQASTGAFVDLESSGSILGLIENAEYECRTFDINTGDKILFYTDGIIEQRNCSSEMYSPERLAGVFMKNIKRDGQSIMDAIIADLEKFTGITGYDDDITMLLYEFK